MDATSMSKPALSLRTVMGYPLVDMRVDDLARSLVDGLPDQCGRSFVCLNPHSYILALDDHEFADALHSADGIICDGIGLSLAATFLVGRHFSRITGYDLFAALSRVLSERGRGRVYFLGGHPEWADCLVARYQEEYPGIAEVRCYSPPFKSQFDDHEVSRMDGAIRDFQPDILWIGLGSPKQEKLLRRLSKVTAFRIAIPIGQVFDFYSGRVKSAPALFRQAGFEWAFRLMQQPGRLGARTFKSAPRFVGHMIRHLVDSHSG